MQTYGFRTCQAWDYRAKISRKVIGMRPGENGVSFIGSLTKRLRAARRIGSADALFPDQSMRIVEEERKTSREGK
jgi:hypothetical protein